MLAARRPLSSVQTSPLTFRLFAHCLQGSSVVMSDRHLFLTRPQVELDLSSNTLPLCAFLSARGVGIARRPPEQRGAPSGLPGPQPQHCVLGHSEGIFELSSHLSG